MRNRCILNSSLTSHRSEPRLLGGAIAAIGRKLQNGVEAPMVHERFVMRAVYVSFTTQMCINCSFLVDYAKLTRKMGGKQAMASSNLRPKSLDQGSPTA